MLLKSLRDFVPASMANFGTKQIHIDMDMKVSMGMSMGMNRIWRDSNRVIANDHSDLPRDLVDNVPNKSYIPLHVIQSCPGAYHPVPRPRLLRYGISSLGLGRR